VYLATAAPCFGHDDEIRSPIVIDTDLGIDDAVALAMALQSPNLEVASVVACESVAAATTASEQLSRLLDYFNRGDVRLFSAMHHPEATPPECRARAAAVIDEALPKPSRTDRHPSSPPSYVIDGHRSTVLALGPLTQLAAALRAFPGTAENIHRVVISGDPESGNSWNLVRDPEAVTAVQAFGVPVVFVRAGGRATKPSTWYVRGLTGGQETSLGEALLDRLLATDNARAHYLETLSSFHDELAVLFLTDPELFTEVAHGIVEPIDERVVADAIRTALSRGRQRKDRVVFIDGPLPDEALQPDVRARKDTILTRNGPDEWFAQLLLNELHEHLGAYSIIGVKMGLRAAELLNAPQHAMTVVSAAPPTQPVSCLNDGLLVSTGSTPGRGLFSHVPGPPGIVEATFEYNGRSVRLRLKDEYRTQIGETIQGLLARFSLEDDSYWSGVRELGLDIWQDWHRRNLFEVTWDRQSSSDTRDRSRQ
jgi:pyrimidine-specific ribonucleoside hydrolase